MEETSFQAVTRLEEKLEKNRKQRQKLKHELGAGRACLICKEKCVGGLNLHFWRKICINCKCKKESHDLLPEDYDEQMEVFEILGVKIPEHRKLFKFATKEDKESKTPAVERHVEWVPPITTNGTSSSEKIMQKYFEDLGEESIPFKNSEAAVKRKEMASMQIPAHDFAPEKCDNLSEFETQQLQKYVDNVKKNYFGQGEVNLAKPIVPAKPTNHLLKTTTNNNNVVSGNVDSINNNLVGTMRNLTMNESHLNCRGCKESITSSYVMAQKLGANAQWHPKCFKCNRCSQLLVDLIYFHYNNEIYCARDLAELMEIPRCSACDELILVPEYTLADGKSYHVKHFCCFHCDLQLAGQQYVSDDTPNNNPVCLPCFDAHYANICSCCGTSIAPTDQGVSLKDVHFHMSCFNCGFCQKVLIGGRFCLRNKIPFCSAACVQSANA